jgi:hypothetical protein
MQRFKLNGLIQTKFIDILFKRRSKHHTHAHTHAHTSSNKFPPLANMCFHPLRHISLHPLRTVCFHPLRHTKDPVHITTSTTPQSLRSSPIPQHISHTRPLTNLSQTAHKLLQSNYFAKFNNISNYQATILHLTINNILTPTLHLISI